MSAIAPADKDALEIANWHIAHTWADGLGLAYAGIDLADLTVYSLLSVLGRVALAAPEAAPEAEAAHAA